MQCRPYVATKGVCDTPCVTPAITQSSPRLYVSL
jgi:hypothetical protein